MTIIDLPVQFNRTDVRPNSRTSDSLSLASHTKMFISPSSRSFTNPCNLDCDLPDIAHLQSISPLKKRCADSLQSGAIIFKIFAYLFAGESSCSIHDQIKFSCVLYIFNYLDNQIPDMLQVSCHFAKAFQREWVIK
jgi:hypothetical protein